MATEEKLNALEDEIKRVRAIAMRLIAALERSEKQLSEEWMRLSR